MKNVRQLLQAKGGAVASIGPGMTVHEAMKIMAERNIGALLVLDGGQLVGVVSERDFARKLFLQDKLPSQLPVQDVMTRDVVYVRPEMTTEECMALMTDKRVRHLPVIENGQVIGVVSIGDLVKETICEQEFIIQQLESYIHR
jgi:CBS domain-containing protein